VANEANFSGGSTAKKGVVTEDDKVRLQAQLLEELKRQALERLDERTGGRVSSRAKSVSFSAAFAHLHALRRRGLRPIFT